MLWMETSTPSLEEAKEFADAIHAKYPGVLYMKLHCLLLSQSTVYGSYCKSVLGFDYHHLS